MPNNSFKPNLLRYTKAMAEKACHGFGSTAQVGLTQALGIRGEFMATEISDWISLAALATSFIAYLEAKKANKTGETVQALTHVIEASEKTQTYLALRADGRSRNRQTEHELAELWSQAAFLISRVNKDLSVRLNAKSRFWRDPDTWAPTLRESKQISLDSVSAEARRLMSAYA